MQSHPQTVFLGTRLGFLPFGLGVLGLALGCGANDDHLDRNKEAANLGYPSPNACPCVRNCLPDPGSRPVDCGAEETGVEFMQVYSSGWPAGTQARIFDFENRVDPPNPAKNLLMYHDYSTRFLVPFQFEPKSPVMPDGTPDGLMVGTVSSEDEKNPQANRCNSGHNSAFHLVGGPFTNWGGGMGISLMKIFYDNCRAAGLNGGPRPDYCPPQGVEFATETLDLSRWEGISLWARRGPEGQAGLRVMLGDKYTDDDLNYMHYNAAQVTYGGKTWKGAEIAPDEPPHAHPKYCERVKKCSCEDWSRPCTLHSAPTGFSDNSVYSAHFCWDPALDDPSPSWTYKTDSCNTKWRQNFCDQEMCDSDYAAFPYFGDEPFKGRPCTRYVFAGSDAGSYCFQPGVDPDPAEGYKRCGDHWYYPITLTTDWQFYMIPFTDLHQEGWAKISDRLDLTAASVLRFTWTTGWVDYWLDDVSFYRHQD
jgi:hypothetical protein